MKLLSLLFAAVMLLSPLVLAQGSDWSVTGQIQLRSELDGRDFSNKTHPLTFASLRTRVGVQKTYGDLELFAQLQDSRIFGEENNTLGNLKNLDLHQGYVKLANLFNSPLSVQAGRFELIYGTERFFGAVGWHYVGRSWDGLRLMIRSGFELDLFALTQGESQAYISNAVPGIYSYPSASIPSSSIYGFWSSFPVGSDNKVEPFFYYDVNRNKPNGTDFAVSRYTGGLSYYMKYASLSGILEGAYQFGKLNDDDLSAYLVSLQLMYGQSGLKGGAGADLLSGTDPEGDKIGAFNPAYGTNHKFYGYMDYFINIPGNTASLGLFDFYVTAGLTPQNSRFAFNLWLHHFASQYELAGEAVFGQELDLTVAYTFIKGTTLSWGGSLFFPGEIMKTFYRMPTAVREDIAFWSYVMITANL